MSDSYDRAISMRSIAANPGGALDLLQRIRAENAALRAALEKHENAARENLISARIIEAENKGRNYGITRDARFILERAQAALAAGGAK